MPRYVLLVLALLLPAPLLVAKDKREPTLPKLVVSARYVMVTTYLGDEPADPRIMPDDRKAVGDVEKAIDKWGRYTLVYQRKDADLIIVVRKGRIAEAVAGARIHVGSQEPSPRIGPVVNGDIGDPQDMLAVYDATQGMDSPPLWRGRQRDGLEPPSMRLVNELQSKVETAAKTP